ncbi:A disintegrin and metalloproteinase with thrombospondin motifs 7-like [Ricinus communis]|uniref:A disintegrin and metalloproteinase with thrombospondin motifs 7-like n=1 Tax=Ricinus communis TaxID=3988 RepID=UPI00201AC3A6|nr:A disintegrin and metalloproteinase with thrombospondin motifs 7-like [Ricinus communis]
MAERKILFVCPSGGVGMEKKKWLFKMYLIIVWTVIAPVLSLNVNIPSHGCYWNVSCQDKLGGECGMGHAITDRSNDCKGLCPEPKYSVCPPPYYTRFYCCIPETPEVTKDRCSKCDTKVDTGDEYICCTDCSDPHMYSDELKSGYCRSGAKLLVEPQPKEVFKWVAGPWKPCSSLCDGGIRYRNVECYAVFADTLVPDYPVYDHKCSLEEMPAREEPCNVRSCLQLRDGDSQGRKYGLTLGLLIFLGIVAISGVTFAGYIQFKRRNSMQYGQVYIIDI